MSDGNVIAALAKVQAEIGGIGKTRPKDGQLSYAYRGIDAIASEAQPLFGREGVVIVPSETVVVEVKELLVNNKPWTDTLILIEWTIYGPGGTTDCITASTYGLGRDNSDKGVNKAATQAFKNLILRILCIGDPQDDADQPQHQNNYTDPRPEPVAHLDPATVEAHRLIDAIKALDEEQMAEFKKWKGARKATAPAFIADDGWRALVSAQLYAIKAGFVADDPNDTTEAVQAELLPA